MLGDRNMSYNVVVSLLLYMIEISLNKNETIQQYHTQKNHSINYNNKMNTLDSNTRFNLLYQ